MDNIIHQFQFSYFFRSLELDVNHQFRRSVKLHRIQVQQLFRHLLVKFNGSAAIHILFRQSHLANSSLSFLRHLNLIHNRLNLRSPRLERHLLNLRNPHLHAVQLGDNRRSVLHKHKHTLIVQFQQAVHTDTVRRPQRNCKILTTDTYFHRNVLVQIIIIIHTSHHSACKQDRYNHTR